MEAPIYRNKPIASVESLSRCLSTPKAQLLRLADKADQFYSLKLIVKPDGKHREVYRVGSSLKQVQKKILQRIFYNVDVPRYLQGGIHDQKTHRDYVANARLHADKRILLREDINGFFPSIKAQHVKVMWQHLFHFSEDVAIVLTKLTTFRGVVPQGASTSTYIGNLIFWDLEPQIEADLRQRDFCYSRYIDDITISANRYVSQKEWQLVTEKVYGMMLSKEMKPNRKKRAVQSNSGQMTVHDLNVNSRNVTLSKQKWSQFRVAVRQVEQMAVGKLGTAEYESLYNHVRGRAAAMSRIQPHKAKPYIARLRLIEPNTQCQADQGGCL